MPIATVTFDEKAPPLSNSQPNNNGEEEIRLPETNNVNDDEKVPLSNSQPNNNGEEEIRLPETNYDNDNERIQLSHPKSNDSSEDSEISKDNCIVSQITTLTTPTTIPHENNSVVIEIDNNTTQAGNLDSPPPLPTTTTTQITQERIIQMINEAREAYTRLWFNSLCRWPLLTAYAILGLIGAVEFIHHSSTVACLFSAFSRRNVSEIELPSLSLLQISSSRLTVQNRFPLL
ncbi:415_t:CDS:2 [Ambispora leptoticha]|uniref:415_t:CDS:1 n=1 Tax=Ambispora leptoticha TaxID=144679 RepID=A0A9N8YPJ8_9GLOM|nr:415_t:CDS:2 [Ambispora leptoticha]